MGPHQLQFLSTLVIIVAAAIIALFCDILMRNNEELREMAIGLKRGRTEQLKIVTAAKQRSATGDVSKHAINPLARAAIERGLARAAAPPIAESRRVRPPAAKPIAARKDWGTLLARNAPAPKIDPNVKLPAGFQENRALRKLIESCLPINGLVVSVSVSAPRNSGGAPPESVIRHLQSLLHSMIGPDDFAAAHKKHQFVLIYPQQNSETAKRRLNLIAQQLWDFQLASMGSLQILLNWGATEASGEPIEKAIAKAVESMEQNRRGRQLATMAQAV
jgi:hypothetical protein